MMQGIKKVILDKGIVMLVKCILSIIFGAVLGICGISIMENTVTALFLICVFCVSMAIVGVTK